MMAEAAAERLFHSFDGHQFNLRRLQANLKVLNGEIAERNKSAAAEKQEALLVTEPTALKVMIDSISRQIGHTFDTDYGEDDMLVEPTVTTLAAAPAEKRDAAEEQDEAPRAKKPRDGEKTQAQQL